MEEKFDVTGMTCAACQANVTRVVSKLDGVSHCDVSLLSNSMKVEFDQDKVNEQTICEAVKQIGYGASVHGEKGEVKKEWQNRQNRVESDQRSAKQRLILSLVLLIPLLVIAMGPMVGLPILEGMEWMMVSALTQLILCLFILFIQRHFFITGFKALIKKSANMDSLVALGLGKYIGIKQRDENIKDVVVTDICPFSLSTSTYNEQNPDLELSTVLIPKNSVLPTSKKLTLRTVHKGQTKVNISVFQGQAMYAKENLFLGQAFIHVPRNMHDYESFDLIYSYDINSMLYVEAIVHSTKEHYIFRVSKGDVLEKVDASVRLDSIKEVSLGLYQNNEVDALLARIEKIYQEVDEETQDYLMKLHTEFTKDMESLINNIQKRKRLINQVSRILDQIEESQNVDQLDIFTQEEDEEGEYLA